ncbi:HigA family addiction module antitoxin [Bavariicoccus seileri]|uniref:HigA family addiction module antitoxin n=1 Tax=Bavariicoccus seileri TaxID=549685 RepID=UPI0003B3D454|nr:HigA family addiction module antitoxin [Bavariicoccus seileri]
MSSECVYKDLIAFHPGSYVSDIIDDLNITQSEFAERLGTSSKTISKIINGEESISNDMANKLAKLTGVSIKTWLNLQSSYDIKMMEIENAQNEDEQHLCDLVDFQYFKNNGFVDKKRYSKKEKIVELRKLLNFSNLSSLFEFNSAVSYRNTQDFSETSIVNSNIMLELATNISRSKTDVKYKKKNLEKVLPEIRRMTLLTPDVFYPRLKKLLLDCGIVVVGLPKLRNANLNGATKKFKNGSVLLLITDRNKSSDIFWFSFVHELGHIYNDDFYSDYKDFPSYSKKEDRADSFALDFFIPQNKYDNFIAGEDFSVESVLKFSNELKISPSIVVGRLQNDRFIEYNHHSNLREKYNFVISN